MRRPQPLRVVFDSSLRTPPDSRLAASAHDVPVLVFAATPDERSRRALAARSVEVLDCPGEDGRVDLPAALETLKGRGVARLLVEGGAEVHGAFLRAGVADQATVLVAPRILGARDAPVAVTGTGLTGLSAARPLSRIQWRKLGDDLLLQGYVREHASVSE